MLTLQLLLFSQFMVFILFNIAQETSRIPQGTVTLDNAKKKLTQLILCDNLFFSKCMQCYIIFAITSLLLQAHTHIHISFATKF